MTGLPLFETPSNARATSEQAAESLSPVLIRKGEWTLLQLLLAHGPLCDYEMQELSGFSGDYERPRRWALEAKLLIACCDGKEGRPLLIARTPSGRKAYKWQLTELGRLRVHIAHL